MLDSLVGLTGLIVVIGLVVVVARQNGRMGLLEREIGALRSLVLSLPARSATQAPLTVPQTAEPVDAPMAEATPVTAEVTSAVAPAIVAQDSAPAGPWSATRAAAGEAADVSAKQPNQSPQPPLDAPTQRRPDLETALGTRWAVWVGGLALALGGLFLVRYTIESGFFGPAARLSIAAVFGLILVGTGEFIRRTGFKLPVQGMAGAYIPAILTAAGVFSLFGAIYAAHGVYGFIGPAPAFFLLGAIGLATLLLALIHGQALAGVGLLGSMATPVLVSSQAPNHWVLFIYLAIVLTATIAVSRIRAWRLLASAAYVMTGIYTLAYLADFDPTNLWIVLFINAVMLASLALIWLGSIIPILGKNDPSSHNGFPAAVPAFFIGMSAFALMIDPKFADLSGPQCGAIVIAAMVAVAFWRTGALPLLFGAGAATMLAYLRIGFGGTFMVEIMGQELTIDGFGDAVPAGPLAVIGAVLGLVFLCAGIWMARKLVATQPWAAACWTAVAGIVPAFILLSLWLAIGNPDRDLAMAAIALVLTLALVAGAELVARAETPPFGGGLAVTFALAGAGAAWLLTLHMACGSALTTILVGASAALPALATRLRSYRVLGGLSVAAAIVTLIRIAIDPTIVGAGMLSTTPVFNILLPAYGIPALAFAFAAWQLARTTDGRPRLAMEAAAALFALLTLAILVRHAMNGGVLDGDAPTLAEQSIYTLITLGAGAILIALDMRSPSSVLRYGSIAVGVASVATIVVQHFLLLNPLFTEESTGGIPFFNLLLLAYLLPAIAAGAVALYARGKRPHWYAVMLGLTAAALVFAYATLSVRRLFKGEFIGLWSGLGQLETYAYSALWLAMGVGLLVVGVRMASNMLRLAFGALIAIAVAKVFLFDMSELEGVLRALSFIGLGAVLIGIGLFYQRLLTSAAKR